MHNMKNTSKVMLALVGKDGGASRKELLEEVDLTQWQIDGALRHLKSWRLVKAVRYKSASDNLKRVKYKLDPGCMSSVRRILKREGVNINVG